MVTSFSPPFLIAQPPHLVHFTMPAQPQARKEALPPGVNFINILCTNFLYKHLFCSFFYVHVTRSKLPKQRLYEKFARKMLMKLTTAVAMARGISPQTGESSIK